MKKIIYLAVFLLALSSVYADEYYFEVNLANNGSLSIENVSIKEGKSSQISSHSGEARIKLISTDLQTLYETNFKTIDYFIVEGGSGKDFFEPKRVYYNISKISLRVPYYENAVAVVVIDDPIDNKQLIADVSNLKPPKEPINYTLIITIASVLLVIILLMIFLRRRTTE